MRVRRVHWLRSCCVVVLLGGGLFSAALATPSAFAPAQEEAQPEKPPVSPVKAQPKAATSPSKPGAAPTSDFALLRKLSEEGKAKTQPRQAATTVKPTSSAHPPKESEALPLPQADARPSAVSSTPVTAGVHEDDMDNLPILFDKAQQEAAEKSSIWLMGRMVLSLLAVLALFFACVKWLLPRLMERYPALFFQLQEQQAGDRPFKRQAFKEQVSDRFNILTSSPLGKEKELHLVEIQGRQLIIATTPYTVSFIKELTEPPSSENDLRNLMAHAGLQEAPAPGNGWLPVNDAQPSPKPSRLESYRSPRSVLPKSRLKPETHSELPARRKIKPKPLAAKVPLLAEPEGDLDPASTGTAGYEGEPYRQPPGQALHLKYLQAETGEHEPLKSDSLRNLFKEPDDVVLLDDYDDVYQDSPRRP